MLPTFTCAYRRLPVFAGAYRHLPAFSNVYRHLPTFFPHYRDLQYHYWRSIELTVTAVTGTFAIGVHRYAPLLSGNVWSLYRRYRLLRKPLRTHLLTITTSRRVFVCGIHLLARR